MKTVLYDYDVFPMVMRGDTETTVTIRPLGKHAAFPKNVEVHVMPLQDRVYPRDDTPRPRGVYPLSPDEDGCLRFTHRFNGEQEHRLGIFCGKKRLCELCVFSVLGDLVGKIPLIGDLHLHTIRSDGREDPATVAAHLRRQGYDFIAITDHSAFGGSLEAIDTFKDAPIEMNLMTGEEIHLPDCHQHVIHVGGRYSINARVQSVLERVEGSVGEMCKAHPECFYKMEGSDFPGTMPDDVFFATVEDYAKTMDPIPDGIPRYTAAAFCWICDEVRKAGGMVIFPHPYWIHDDVYDEQANHVDERYTEYLFEKKPFDAFEVLGGENYYQQNGFQAQHYYDAKARGFTFPVVGSSDSHASVNNRNAFIAETICFAEENTSKGVTDAVRAGLSVALDTISTEYRLVGDYRLTKYASFLVENFFPLHKDACGEQGRAMKEYFCGDREEGLAILKATDGRIAKMWKKYFAF